MRNSIDTILQDIKKLFKELESAYGEIKPQLCDAQGFDDCPNTKCWVQRIRDEQSDKIFAMERVILTVINDLTEIQRGAINKEDITKIIQKLDVVINPTPCKSCIKYMTCKEFAYKNAAIHEEPCVNFTNKSDVKDDEEPDIAVQF